MAAMRLPSDEQNPEADVRRATAVDTNIAKIINIIHMQSLRIGTDRTIIWKIGYNGEPYDMTGKNIRLQVTAPNYSFCVPKNDIIINGNTIIWVFRGKDQKQLGPYTLTLTENSGLDAMLTFDIRNAFCLVSHTDQETGQDPAELRILEIEFESDLATLGLLLVRNPIDHGDAPNTAQLHGEKNRAISEASVALGSNNLTGLKGWYYAHIQKVSDTRINVYLCDEQVTPTMSSSKIGDQSAVNPLAIIGKGAIVSLVNDSKYDNMFIVNNGRAGMIQLDMAQGVLPFDSIDIEEDLSPEDYSIYCLEKPDAGVADIGQHSFASGLNNQATNGSATSEGFNNHSYGKFSHTEGRDNKAGYAAHAEGAQNMASGTRSHAEGYDNTAKGNGSHVEGQHNIANGQASHAEGYYTETTNVAEHAEGKYNTSHKGTIHSVGIGTSEEGRKNAHEITDSGKHYILDIGGYDGTNPSESSDLAKVISDISENKVDKVRGKGLSTNDYTTTEKNKLKAIESGAEKNIIPDWSASTYKKEHIKNRTHHMVDYMAYKFKGSPITISKPSSIGLILLTYDTDLEDKFIRIKISSDESKTYETLDASGLPIIFTWNCEDSTINVQTFGGAVETYDIRAYYSPNAKEYQDYFVALDEDFIPRSIARVSYMKSYIAEVLDELNRIPTINFDEWDPTNPAEGVGADSLRKIVDVATNSAMNKVRAMGSSNNNSHIPFIPKGGQIYNVVGIVLDETAPLGFSYLCLRTGYDILENSGAEICILWSGELHYDVFSAEI